MAELKDRKLLIIDDEPDLRLMLADFFEDEGALTATAADGDSGLARLRDWCPDVVLVDLNMPGLDGFGFIKQAAAEAPETPLIVISGGCMAGDVVRAVRLGAWEYIQKPIHDLSFLHSVLGRVLKKAKRMRKDRLYRENLEQVVEAQARLIAAKGLDQAANEANRDRPGNKP
jgi:putative two-component system response regulator